MIFQLYLPCSKVNEDSPKTQKRILHDVNLFSIAQFTNNHSDLLSPDKTAGTDTILKYANHYTKGQEDEINYISLAAILKLYFLALYYHSCVNIKNFKEITVFWYSAISDGSFYFSDLQFLFIHHDGVGEETVTSSLQVNTLRCDDNCTGHKVFIADGKWTLVIMTLYNGLRYIAFFLNIEVGNRNHVYKKCIEELKYSITHRENDPVASGAYCTKEYI